MHILICVYIHIHIYIYICTHINTYYVCMCVFIYIYAYAVHSTYLYICTHTNTCNHADATSNPLDNPRTTVVVSLEPPGSPCSGRPEARGSRGRRTRRADGAKTWCPRSQAGRE